MIYIILLLAFILRLIGINQSLWLDEGAQAILSQGSIKSLWIGNADFHPPVFHTILHFWMKISESEVFMRLLPVLIGILTVYVLYLFGKKYFNEKIALISSFLLTVSPYHIFYSQDLRSYSLLVLFSLLSIYCFLGKKWKIFAVINIIAFFTNYVYVFVIFSEFCLIIFSRKKKNIINFILSNIPLLIIFIFWLPQFMLQLQAGAALVMTLPEWRKLSSPGVLNAIPLTLFKLIAGQIAIQKNPTFSFYAFLIISIVIWIFWKLFKRKDSKLWFFSLITILPIVTAWVISFFIPLNNPPRLIFVLPFLYLLIAHYIVVVKDKHLIFIFLSISLFGIFMQNFALINRREDWRGAVDFIDKNSIQKKQTLAVFEFIAPFAPWQWYEKSGIEGVGAVPSKANIKDIEKYLSPSLVGKTRVYLFEYFADVTDPKRLVRKYLEENKFQVVDFYEFNNLGFVYELRRPSLF